MRGIDSLTHVGITVSDIERSIAFYCENFDLELVRRNQFDERFFAAARTLYGLEGATCKTAILGAPNGVQLELFQFSVQLPPQPVPWNRVGITHIALTTGDVPALAAALRPKGVEFCMEVLVRPDGGRWVFVRDPDGNLIELMEPFQAG